MRSANFGKPQSNRGVARVGERDYPIGTLSRDYRRLYALALKASGSTQMSDEGAKFAMAATVCVFIKGSGFKGTMADLDALVPLVTWDAAYAVMLEWKRQLAISAMSRPEAWEGHA